MSELWNVEAPYDFVAFGFLEIWFVTNVGFIIELDFCLSWSLD